MDQLPHLLTATSRAARCCCTTSVPAIWKARVVRWLNTATTGAARKARSKSCLVCGALPMAVRWRWQCLPQHRKPGHLGASGAQDPEALQYRTHRFGWGSWLADDGAPPRRPEASRAGLDFGADHQASATSGEAAQESDGLAISGASDPRPSG